MRNLQKLNPKVEEKTLYERKRDYKAVIRNIPRYINENRMNSLESKIGIMNVNDEEKLNRAIQQFCDDAWTDFKENDDKLWESLSAEEQDMARNESKIIIRQFFIEQKNKQ